MERPGKPRHGLAGRRLSEPDVSESNPAAEPQVIVTRSLDCGSVRSAQDDTLPGLLQ